MITLLSPPRRAWLISFWLVMSLGSGLLIGLLLALLMSPRWFGFGVMLALVLALPGLLWPQAIARPYMAWNRLARYFASAASLRLMRICYYIVFVAVGRTGSSLSLAHPPSTTSLWIPRGTLAPSAYVSQHGVATKASPEQGWVAAFLSWAAQSGNVWALSLLPFFILLVALRTDQKKSSFPANIYTLF
jgi:hypothetical protein